MSVLNRSSFQGHPFHLVSPSPWPLFTCISLLTLTTSGVSFMHGFESAGVWLPLSLVLLIASMSFWFRDVISEGTYLGNHTLAVQKGLNMGVALFIVSEALFFLAIFWAYFHSALSPTVELGTQWPPIGIEAINAFELPLLNTVLLLASGVTITYAHHCLIQGNRNGALYGGFFTILLAIVFTGFQGVEYSVSSFTISDGAFGSCFYFGTGLISAPIISTNNNTSNINNSNIDFPYWVTGLSDAESSFSIRVAKSTTRKHGIRITPIFSIELRVRDKYLLNEIRYYFKVGTIIQRVRGGKSTVLYIVHSPKDLKEKIIPHFVKYPLLSQKKSDFIIFSKVLRIMVKNKHLTYDNIIEILSLKSCMKKGISSDLVKLFPTVKIGKIIPILSEKIVSKSWLIGFIERKGNFYINIKEINNEIKRITAVFSISQHSEDTHLMNLIKDYLNCGNLKFVPTIPNIVNFVVYSTQDISHKIITLFNNCPLIGIKRFDCQDFSEAVSLMEKGEHLTEHGKKRIALIKGKMNTKRKENSAYWL